MFMNCSVCVYLFQQVLVLFQQLDGLKRQRDRLREELAVVMEVRNKKQNLSTLESNLMGLENKIRYANRDKQVQVCHVCVVLMHCMERMLSLSISMLQLDHNIPRNARELEVIERELKEIEVNEYSCVFVCLVVTWLRGCSPVWLRSKALLRVGGHRSRS